MRTVINLSSGRGNYTNLIGSSPSDFFLSESIIYRPDEFSLPLMTFIMIFSLLHLKSLPIN